MNTAIIIVASVLFAAAAARLGLSLWRHIASGEFTAGRRR